MNAVGILTRGMITQVEIVNQPTTTAAPKMKTVITVKPKIRSVKSS